MAAVKLAVITMMTNTTIRSGFVIALVLGREKAVQQLTTGRLSQSTDRFSQGCREEAWWLYPITPLINSIREIR